MTYRRNSSIKAINCMRELLYPDYERTINSIEYQYVKLKDLHGIYQQIKTIFSQMCLVYNK